MGTNQEVEAWFRVLDHPLKDPMLEVRKVILAIRERRSPGSIRRSEAGGNTTRYMPFADAGEVAAKKAHLEAAVRAWIDMKSG